MIINIILEYSFDDEREGCEDEVKERYVEVFIDCHAREPSVKGVEKLWSSHYKVFVEEIKNHFGISIVE